MPAHCFVVLAGNLKGPTLRFLLLYFRFLVYTHKNKVTKQFFKFHLYSPKDIKSYQSTWIFSGNTIPLCKLPVLTKTWSDKPHPRWREICVRIFKFNKAAVSSFWLHKMIKGTQAVKGELSFLGEQFSDALRSDQVSFAILIPCLLRLVHGLMPSGLTFLQRKNSISLLAYVSVRS